MPCGERGIRTLGPLMRSTVFETAPFDHSGISPISKSFLKNKSDYCSRFISAEKEGFEPPVHCCTTVFKTAAIDHSAISPLQRYNFFVSCKLFLKKIFFLLQSPNKSSIFVIANEKFFYKYN